uniref:protein L-Myc-1-B-like n=1 Tax=Myxine glutinosa TaxID=7769 RepID=UPI00358FB4BB
MPLEEAFERPLLFANDGLLADEDLCCSAPNESIWDKFDLDSCPSSPCGRFSPPIPEAIPLPAASKHVLLHDCMWNGTQQLSFIRLSSDQGRVLVPARPKCSATWSVLHHQNVDASVSDDSSDHEEGSEDEEEDEAREDEGKGKESEDLEEDEMSEDQEIGEYETADGDDDDDDNETSEDEEEKIVDIETVEWTGSSSTNTLYLNSVLQASEPLSSAFILQQQHNYAAPAPDSAGSTNRTSSFCCADTHRPTEPRAPDTPERWRCGSHSSTGYTGSSSDFSSGSESDERGRRRNHNALERRRREGLKRSFRALRQVVDELAGNERAAKVLILHKATELAAELRDTEHRLLAEKRELLRAVTASSDLIKRRCSDHRVRM